jgi:hypothetical protein
MLKGNKSSDTAEVRSFRDATPPLFRSFLARYHQILCSNAKKGDLIFIFSPANSNFSSWGYRYRDLLASPGRSSLLIQSFFSTAISGHCAHSYSSRSLRFFPLVRHASGPGRHNPPHVFLEKKETVSEGRWVEQDAHLRRVSPWTLLRRTGCTYHTHDRRVYESWVNIILPTRDEKKRERKKSLHIFRRTSWETLAWRSNWCLLYTSQYEVFFI